jgi:hypothetical protein
MPKPAIRIPRARWAEYFQRMSRLARGTSSIIDEPAKPAPEAGIPPLPLIRIEHRSDSDEVVITVGDAEAQHETLPAASHSRWASGSTRRSGTVRKRY